MIARGKATPEEFILTAKADAGISDTTEAVMPSIWEADRDWISDSVRPPTATPMVSMMEADHVDTSP